MKFSQLATYIEKIESTGSRLTITNLLAELFKKLSEGEIGNTVYLLQGRLVPQYENTEFGMAEKTVVKAAIFALNVEKKYFDDKNKTVGDLGRTVEFFKKQYPSLEQKDFSINEIYEKLLRMATSTGNGSQELKINIMADMIRRIDPLSSRYLVRIPLGIMRLGFSDMTVLDSISWMLKGDKSLRPLIEKAYHVRPDLGFITQSVKKDGIKGLDKITPKLFTPIIMMRAERLSSGHEIIEKIGSCLVEPKYDGFRLQIHYKKSSKFDDVRLYSRSLENVTFMYPDIVEAVKREVDVDEIIFEGEAIGYDPKNNRFLPFQETVQRKRKYGIEEKIKEIPLKLFAFELLYLNGKSYLETNFQERRKTLERAIKISGDVTKDNILLAPEEIVVEDKKIEALFEDAIGRGLEGIIAKKLTGIYQPGARGWNWIKFKRSYTSKINDTIDCLVMGYDLGRGKRTGFGIGAFLVGVYDEQNDRFITVAKIGTGLSDEEWKELQIKSQKLKIKNKPNNYIIDKMMECDVWISPAIVVEIKADEISRSPVHTAEYALRFPRLQKFRDDKSPYETTTLVELKKMYKLQQH